MPSKEANEKTYPSLVVFYYFDPPKIKKGEGMVMYSVINTRIGIVSLPLQSIILVRWLKGRAQILNSPVAAHVGCWVKKEIFEWV